MNTRIIQHVSVEPDGGLQIASYHPDTDITHTGIVQMHTLIVPIGSEYDDEIRAVIDAINHLISDVMEDYEQLPKLGQPE